MDGNDEEIFRDSQGERYTVTFASRHTALYQPTWAPTKAFDCGVW
jgi:hypothetical protein